MHFIDPTATSHNGESQQAPDAAVAVKRAEFLVDMPPDLDPDHFPIIARHFFGWPPGRPTRENLLRLIRSPIGQQCEVHRR